jgi:hypothetical protein
MKTISFSLLPLLLFTGLLGTWFGAALFYVIIVGKTLVYGSTASIGFLKTLANRKGTGIFFAILAFLSVIAGIWSYVANDIYKTPFGASGLWVTIGTTLAIIALLLGASANRSAEGHWIRAVKRIEGPATAEQGTELTAAIAKAEKVNAVTAAVICIALICIVMSQVFA